MGTTNGTLDLIDSVIE